MYIGQLAIRLGGIDYNSPTFPRGGLAGLFSIEIFDLTGSSPTLECDIEHKNEEDVTFSVAASFSSMSTAAVHTKDVSGLKEQLRLVFRVGGAAAMNTVYFNVMSPAWRPY